LFNQQQQEQHAAQTKQVCKRGTEWGMWGTKGGVMRAENSGKVGGEVGEEFCRHAICRR